MQVYSRDGAGNQGATGHRAFSIGQPTAVSITAIPSTVNSGQSITLTAHCAGCDGKTANFWWSLLNDRGITPLTSCVISGGSCAKTVTAPHNADFKVWALVDINGDGDTNDTGEKSPNATVNVIACNKGGLLHSDTFATVKTATGTKQSPIRITHIGADSDSSPAGSGVIYEFLGSAPQGATIQMDDKPLGSGDCDNDLTWDAFWGDPFEAGFNFFTTVRKFSVDYTGSHTLSYGFQILTDTPTGKTAVIKDSLVIECSVTGTLCPVPSSSGDRFFSILGPIDQNGTTGATGFGRKFNIVECTTNAHCTGNSDANANTATCNLGITNNFPQTTCIDSVAPTITIGEIKRTHSETRTLLATPESLGTAGTGQWLKGGIYEISVTVQDNHPMASGVDTSYRLVIIRSAGLDGNFDTPGDNKVYPLTRGVDNKFSVWVGPDDDPSHPSNISANDCVDELEGRCRIEVLARDLVGNETVLLPFPLLNIDYTAPSVQ